eukprot:2759896-Pyramimonas_sp.AAC.2
MNNAQPSLAECQKTWGMRKGRGAARARANTPKHDKDDDGRGAGGKDAEADWQTCKKAAPSC